MSNRWAEPPTRPRPPQPQRPAPQPAPVGQTRASRTVSYEIPAAPNPGPPANPGQHSNRPHWGDPNGAPTGPGAATSGSGGGHPGPPAPPVSGPSRVAARATGPRQIALPDTQAAAARRTAAAPRAGVGIMPPAARVSGPVAISEPPAEATAPPELPVRPAWVGTLAGVSVFGALAMACSTLIPWQTVRFMLEKGSSATLHDWWTTTLFVLTAVFCGAAGAAASTRAANGASRRIWWRVLGLCFLLQSCNAALGLDPKLSFVVDSRVPQVFRQNITGSLVLAVMVMSVLFLLHASTTIQRVSLVCAGVFVSGSVLLGEWRLPLKTTQHLIFVSEVWFLWVALLLVSLAATLEQRTLRSSRLAAPRTLTR